MGKVYGNRLLVRGHRTDSAKAPICFPKRPDRDGLRREGLDEEVEQTIHNRLFVRRLLKCLGDLEPLRTVVIFRSIKVPRKNTSNLGACRF